MSSISKYSLSRTSVVGGRYSKAVNLTFFSLSSHNYIFRINCVYVRVVQFYLDSKSDFVLSLKKKKLNSSYRTLNSNKSFPEDN